MSSLQHCCSACEHFLRSALPFVAKTTDALPSLPSFGAEPTKREGEYHFVELKEPNWWQLPKELCSVVLDSGPGRSFTKLLESTPPFCHILGKTLHFQELGRSHTYESSEEIALEFLRSYLFAAGPSRWKPAIFNNIWGDLVNYFNPDITTIEYSLYAPIAFMSGVAQSLKLDHSLEIKRLSASEVAKLATINPTLAGVSLHHRFTLWPLHFFVKPLTFGKRVSGAVFPQRHIPPYVAQLNEEVAILRSLFNEHLAVPCYALLRDTYPRDPGGGPPTELPWRVRYPYWRDAPRREDARRYARLRTKYFALRGTRGWKHLAASMRRFAMAWENPFRSDILADVVAALESLVVRNDTEVSYRLRVRVAHFLAQSAPERQEILKNLSDAYTYRSRTFHGGFVFDNSAEWESAIHMKAAKGRQGNPFHDVNEVRRLIYQVTIYYRQLLINMIESGQAEFNWTALGL
jgi:hypothetical protein